MVESVWSGFLRLSLVSCPVRLAPAASEAHLVRLDPLNSRTGNPLTCQFVDSRTGDVVAADAVVSGCRTAAAGYVTISDSELAELAGEAANVIDVAHFARSGQIDRARLETSYYLYSDGQLAADTLDAVRVAMQRSGRDAIAYLRLGARERECMALIQPHAGGLMLTTLRRPPAFAPPDFVVRPESEVPAEMVEIAQAIIERRAFDGDANALPDRYEDRLRDLVARKSGESADRGGNDGADAAAPPVVAAASPIPPAAPEVPAPQPPAEPASRPAPPEKVPSAAAADIAAAPEAEPEPQPIAAAVDALPEQREAAPAGADPEPPYQMVAATEEGPFDEPPPIAPSQGPGRELDVEILLHIMGLGDRRFIEPGWAGHPGSRRQIEAISIRPRDELDPGAVEFRVFAEEGRATAWVSNGNYAGTRGRHLPLTGFAVRPAAELHDRFDIVYEGSFFEGGVIGPRFNGEVCASPVPNDPLEAIRVSIVERLPRNAEL